jgi:hypothetical protein
VKAQRLAVQLAAQYIRTFECYWHSADFPLPPPYAAAELLKACSHPTRLAILHELLGGPKCVTLFGVMVLCPASDEVLGPEGSWP